MEKCILTNKSIVVLLTLFVLWSGYSWGQDTLSTIVDESETGWIIGRWEATTDEGTDIILTYKWGIEKCAIVSSVKMGDNFAIQGLIYFSPEEEKVLGISVDKKGKISKSEWTGERDKITSISERVNEYGEKQNWATVFTKTKADTIKIELFSIESEMPSDEAWWSMEFKKVKMQPKDEPTTIKE